MRFLSVADRELRSAARHKATYRTRWITAALFFGLLVWLVWAFDGFTNRRAGPEIFRVYSVLTLLYCLFLGTARTADSISVERREGTLGLLFLTNLNSAEIIAGKLCSTALASVYGLMAIFPMLALPLLMGGITFGHFARTVLALLIGIFLALSAGFLASVLCRRQFTAIALATGMTAAFAGGLMLAAEAANSYGPTKPLANGLAIFSPLYTVRAAEGTRLLGSNLFWHSAATVAAMAFSWLGLTILLLARTWRDRPKSVQVWVALRFWRCLGPTHSANRATLRRRWLAINPLFWLASRQRVSAPVLMVLSVVLTLITVYVAAPYFGRVMGAGIYSQVVGLLFAWLWAGLAIHALVLYYAAMSASQRLAEDKQSGALELLLSTPTTEQVISRGLWLAYCRKMLFPALLAVLVHVYFLWQVVVMATLDPPGQLPAGATPGEIFWCALLERPLRGRILEWQFGFLLRSVLLSLLLLMLTWPTLGWVGRWLGLRMKHPGFAPMASLALLLVPPALLFSAACYLADKLDFYRLPARQCLPVMMWLALAIGCGHCLALSVWAATRLRNGLRAVALSRYQPLPPWRWRLPSRRTVLRFASASVVFAALVALLVVSYFGYQNWHGKRNWRAFQNSIKRNGESLSIAPLLSASAAEEANFARSPAFLALLSRTNRETADLFDRLKQFDLPPVGFGGNALLMDWARQTNSPLRPFVNVTRRQSGSGLAMKRADDAAAILQTLQPESGRLGDLATAAAHFSGFQTSTNRDARAVLHPAREPALMLERLHLLFQVRACASLALGKNTDAAEDVLAGLRLARLARQLPDSRSAMRAQALLTRSLQPLWEGLSQQAWTEPQLAAFQRELAGFDLLADYTNAVRRVVLSYIDVWSAIPDNISSETARPVADASYMREPVWGLQPSAWWFERCIELYNAGRNTIEQVDVGAGRIQQAMGWSDLSGLPLDSPSRELFQQSFWWGPNSASVAFAQTSVNQAIVACALERFRLANNTCPETLEELVPTLLDRVQRDAVSGRPMMYQPGAAGHYILRGVGPNGIDDRKNKSSDDWLWTYPTNTASANK